MLSYPDDDLPQHHHHAPVSAALAKYVGEFAVGMWARRRWSSGNLVTGGCPMAELSSKRFTFSPVCGCLTRVTPPRR